MLVPPICATLILLLLVIRLALIARVAEARAEELAHQSATLARALAEQDALQRTLAYRALHDPLTGVANRYVLTDRMDHLSGKPCRGQALMMLDLDGFKDINDTHGASRRRPGPGRRGASAGERAPATRPCRCALGETSSAFCWKTRLGMKPGGWRKRRWRRCGARSTRQVERCSSPPASAWSSRMWVPAHPSASDGLRDADQALYAAKAAGR